MRAEHRLRESIDDLFLPDQARLGDRTRLTLRQMLRTLVETIARDLRSHAAASLAGRGAAILAADDRVFDRLIRSGLLRDGALVAELIARVRQDLIGQALPIAVGSPDMPSLLVQLATSADGGVAPAAQALLAADSRRRAALERGEMADVDLPPALRTELVWLVAAAIRDGDEPEIDQALVAASDHRLAVRAETPGAEAAAMTLARAIDARIDERAMLLLDALGDRRLGLFIAVIAHGLRLSADQVRAIVLEPDGDRLWLALRALELDRGVIAQIGLALADADPARDIEALADQLDAIAAVPAAAARSALAPLALPRDFRRAIAAVTHRPRELGWGGNTDGAWAGAWR